MANKSVYMSVVLADNMSKPLTKIGRGFAVFSKEAIKAQKKVEPLTKKISKLGKTVAKHSKDIDRFGRNMAIMGTATVTALGFLEKASRDFEQQIANVSTLLNDQTMRYLPEYSDAVKNLSISMGESTATLNKGLYDIISASIDASKAIDVLKVSAKAARAGLTSTAVAGDAITTILNAYSLSADEASTVSDKLFAIVVRGKTTFGELAPNIGKIATLAASAGLSFNELGAAISTLTRAGIKTEEAMTAVRGILNAFLTPGEESAAVAEKLGFSLNVASLKGEGLIKVLGKLAKGTTEQVATIAPNIRGLVGLQGLIQQAGGYAKDLQLMINAAGLTQEAFAKNTDTASFAMDQLKASLQIVRIELGDAFAPILIDLSKKVVKWVEGLRGWITENRELMNNIGDLIFSFGKYAIIYGVLISLGGKLIGVWKLLSVAALAMNKANVALTLSTNLLRTSTIGLAGALGAVGIIAAGLVVLYLQYKSSLDKVVVTQKLTNKIIKKTSGIIKESQDAWEEYSDVVVDANEKISMASKKAAIEQNIVDVQRRLIQAQADIEKFSGFLSRRADLRMAISARVRLQDSLAMNQQALTELSAQWRKYVIKRKKEEEKSNEPKHVGAITQQMKDDLAEVENAIIAIKEGKRAADLANLEIWFKKQQEVWKGHSKQLLTIETFYNLKRKDLNKKAGLEIIKELEKEQKARKASIETQNELAKSGVISFGDAQAKNRTQLDLLNAKIEESKQKLRELFIDSPKLADEFISKIDEMTAAIQVQKDEASQVFTGFEAGMRNATDGMVRWADIGVKAGEMVTSAIADGVSNAFVDAIRGTKDFGDAMKEMASQVLADLAKMIIKAIILRSVMAVMGFGNGGEVPAPVKAASGGEIPGPNVNRDVVPAMLTPGEYVEKKAAVDYYGVGVMRALNNMLIPRAHLASSISRLGGVNNSRSFASGGKVGNGKSAPTPAYVMANEQTLDRLLAGGNSAMLSWMSANKSALRSIIG